MAPPSPAFLHTLIPENPISWSCAKAPRHFQYKGIRAACAYPNERGNE